MQNKVINHPLRKITFEYDETKPWTARDEKLLKLYLQMHDYEAKRHHEAGDLAKRFGALEKKIEKIRTLLREVEKKVTASRDAADRIAEKAAAGTADRLITKFADRVNTTNTVIQQYDSKIRELETELNDLNKLKNHYLDEDENPETSLWERLSELKITYAHDKRLATDYVSFDDDEERFRERVSYLSREIDRHTDYCDRVIENYNRLLLETTVQYEVWKEFGRRIELLQRLTGSQPGFPDFSSN